jgi:outer membrane receptor protein involved in Fe transport
MRNGTIFLFIAAFLALRTAAPAAEPPAPDVATVEGPATPSPEQANLTEKSLLMPEVVVTATRTEKDPSDIAQSVTVVTRREIERRQPLNLNEMLREEPGVWTVQAAPQGSPVIRGQIGNRVLYLWDGIPLNNGAIISGPNGNFNQFPAGAVDRIEVIRGPGSVQYGSGAIGGVINIISRKINDFPATLRYGGEVYSRYGMVNSDRTETVDLWVADWKFGLMGGFTFQNVDDYRGPGAGVQENTGYKASGGYLNLAYRPLINHTLRLSAIEYYVQSKLNANGIPRVFNPYERRGIYKAEYQADRLGFLSDELKAYTYFQHYSQIRERRTETGTTFTNSPTDQDQHIYGGGVQNSVTVAGKHRITFGIDYRAEDLKSTVTQYALTKATGITVVSTPTGKTPDGTYDVFDSFLLTELNPSEKLTISAAGRVEQTHLKSNPSAADVIPNAGYSLQDLQLDKTWFSTTWSVGAIYRVTHSLDLTANIATGFRAPTFSDTLSTGTPIFSSRIASVPSPNAEPEKSITYEFGPRYHDENWNFVLTGYWTELTDVLRSVDGGSVTIPGQGTYTARRSVNAGEGFVRGVEMAVAFKPHSDWTFFGNLTYTEGEDTKFHEFFRFIPPLTGVVGARYEAPSRSWWLEAVEVMANRLIRHAPNDEQDATFSRDPGLGSPGSTNPPLSQNFEMPGYAITNIRGGWKIWRSRSDNRSFELTCDINNLFNKSYREAYSQQELVAPGFNFIVGGRIKF